MPGKILPPNITIPTDQPSAATEKKSPGNWKGKDVSNAPSPDNKTFRRVSETDSGIGTPLSNRSISPASNSEISPDSSETFRFDEAAIRAAILNDTAKLAPSKLGKGGHGSVYKVIVKDESGTEHFLALKVTNTEQSSHREQDIMESISTHPNIARYYGEAEIEGQKGMLFEYIAGPSLERLYSELLSTPMPAEERMNAIQFLEQQKLEAAAHTDNFDIVHSDQKPSNFLYNPKTGIVKLIDFGESVRTGDKFEAGHEDYAAPETLKTMGSRSRGPEAKTSMDSYAMGQMLYRQILTKEGELGAPFMFGANIDNIKNASERQIKIFRTIMAMQPLLKAEQEGGVVQVLDTTPESIRNRAYQMAKSCLQAPNKQGAEEAAEEGETSAANSSEDQPAASKEDIQAEARKIEPEILQASLLINKLMHINPNKRVSAKEALKHPWFQLNPANPEKAIQTLSALDL